MTTPTPATLSYAPRYCDDGEVPVLIISGTAGGGLRVRRLADGVEYEVLGYEVAEGLVKVALDPRPCARCGGPLGGEGGEVVRFNNDADRAEAVHVTCPPRHVDQCAGDVLTPAAVAARRLAAELTDELAAAGWLTLAVEPHTSADGVPYATVVDPPPHDVTALARLAMSCESALRCDAQPGRLTVWALPPTCDQPTVVTGTDVILCGEPATAVVVDEEDLEHLGCVAHADEIARATRGRVTP